MRKLYIASLSLLLLATSGAAIGGGRGPAFVAGVAVGAFGGYVLTAPRYYAPTHYYGAPAYGYAPAYAPSYGAAYAPAYAPVYYPPQRYYPPRQTYHNPVYSPAYVTGPSYYSPPAQHYTQTRHPEIPSDPTGRCQIRMNGNGERWWHCQN